MVVSQAFHYDVSIASVNRSEADSKTSTVSTVETGDISELPGPPLGPPPGPPPNLPAKAPAKPMTAELSRYEHPCNLVEKLDKAFTLHLEHMQPSILQGQKALWSIPVHRFSAGGIMHSCIKSMYHRRAQWCALRRVIAALAEQEDWPKVWAFDGRKNIYAAKLFLPQHENIFEVRDLLPMKCNIFHFINRNVTAHNDVFVPCPHTY